MKINQKLKELRISLGMTMLELSKKVGVSEATISRWESGDIANMRRDKIVLLARALEVSPSVIMGWDEIEYLADKSSVTKSETLPQLSARENMLVVKYKKLNEKGKSKADSHMNYLTATPKYMLLNKETTEEPTTELIYYDVPVSAGLGQPLDESSGKYLTIKNTLIPDGTSYLLRVNGDSMEPTYSDGDKIFIADKQVDIGRVGIFSVNGEVFVKELQSDGLLSHNVKYEKINFHEGDAIYCLGSVLGIYEKSYVLVSNSHSNNGTTVWRRGSSLMPGVWRIQAPNPARNTGHFAAYGGKEVNVTYTDEQQAKINRLQAELNKEYEDKKK